MRTKSLLFFMMLACAAACSPEQAPPAAPQTTATTATTATATAAPPCATSEQTLCPVDEGAADPTFAKYREALRAAIASRNEKELLALADPKIRTSFGGDQGLKLSDSKIWDELARAIALGGAFRGEGADRMFWAPYVYSSWPESIDAFTHVAAVRDDVPLREQPAADAAVVDTLRWTIVELIPSDSASWRHVRTPGGKTGWVEAAGVRSPIGYRAGFRQVDGQWKMNAFVAGD